MKATWQPKSRRSFSFGTLFKDWKPPAVLIVLIWSLLTLVQIEPTAKVADWQRLGALPPAQLNAVIQKQAEKLPGWSKMNQYEQEDIIKRELEQAQTANSIQIFKRIGKYDLFTSLKLGLDLRGGTQLVLQALPAPPSVPEITPEIMRGVETVINNRINSLGVSETVVQRSGKDRLIVELPGIKDPQQAKDRIGTTALLEFKELDFGPAGRPTWKDVALTGAQFKHAQAVPMAASSWRVTFEFKPDGAKRFAELTTRLVGHQIGIFLDGEPTERGADGRPLTLAEYRGVTVREPILAGAGEITGNFTKDQAVDLAVKLNAGSLPTPVRILEERTVGATLGQDSIQKSLIAGFVGISMVMAFMLLIYGIPGLVADVALVLYALATLAIFKASSVTLTLAGIAGFILSIGMAVDANILIFERTKEELRSGKTLYTAIENGWKRAFTSIRDSNINSLIACGVLMLFGTSIVKGFAVTLGIGVIVSMFTAISATRVLFHLVPRQLVLFGQGSTIKKKEAANAGTN